MCAILQRCLRNKRPIFSHFDRTLVCDGRTDELTDKWTETDKEPLRIGVTGDTKMAGVKAACHLYRVAGRHNTV